MRAERIVARGFRNLTDLDLLLPPAGGVFLGPNGHGKTNLLELLYYPVLFRSLRGSRDGDVARHGDAGFHLKLSGSSGQAGAIARGDWQVAVDFRSAGKQKRVLVDGSPAERLSDALGQWLAVTFLPTDLQLIHGPAALRRQYLDRVLALANRGYLRALGQYRRALAQRNAALRQQRADLARAFDGTLATSGAEIVRLRLAWVREVNEGFQGECDGLGEPTPLRMQYRGDDSLGESSSWAPALERSLPRDQARGMTSVGPHRHDLELRLGNRLLRDIGSTGQQRTAAIALKLSELATLESSARSCPALLLDDVFAELDQDRQERLARRLAQGSAGMPQTFLTSPRAGELPRGFPLDRFGVSQGSVTRLERSAELVA